MSLLASWLSIVFLTNLAHATNLSVNIFFGCGSFWRVQHEFVLAEQRILGRSTAQLTALAGYAGGTGLNKAGRVCYPFTSRDDDAELHHAEVVQLRVPHDKVLAIARIYWSLFRGIDRADVQDVGPLYRSIIGLPGGMQSEFMPVIDAGQTGITAQRFRLQEGHGGDPDTLGEPLVWVMDSNRFAFYQAEVSHQFHMDLGGKYSTAYYALKQEFIQDCRLVPTGCRGDEGPPRAQCQTLSGGRGPAKPCDSNVDDDECCPLRLRSTSTSKEASSTSTRVASWCTLLHLVFIAAMWCVQAEVQPHA